MENFELKYIVPILGIILGWLLSQLSGSFAIAREERSLYSSALPAMIDFHFQQYRINKILEYFNLKFGDTLEEFSLAAEAGSFTPSEHKQLFKDMFLGFEKSRQQNINLPEKNKELLFKSLELAIDSLSKVDAVSAYRLSRLMNEYILATEIKFPEDELNYISYLKTYEHLLSIYRNDLKSLKKIILIVAFKISIFQFIRIFLLLRQEEQELNSVPKETIDHALKTVKHDKSEEYN